MPYPGFLFEEGGGGRFYAIFLRKHIKNLYIYIYMHIFLRVGKKISEGGSKSVSPPR